MKPDGVRFGMNRYGKLKKSFLERGSYETEKRNGLINTSYFFYI